MINEEKRDLYKHLSVYPLPLFGFFLWLLRLTKIDAPYWKNLFVVLWFLCIIVSFYFFIKYLGTCLDKDRTTGFWSIMSWFRKYLWDKGILVINTDKGRKSFRFVKRVLGEFKKEENFVTLFVREYGRDSTMGPYIELQKAFWSQLPQIQRNYIESWIKGEHSTLELIYNFYCKQRKVTRIVFFDFDIYLSKHGLGFPYKNDQKMLKDLANQEQKFWHWAEKLNKVGILKCVFLGNFQTLEGFGEDSPVYTLKNNFCEPVEIVPPPKMRPQRINPFHIVWMKLRPVFSVKNILIFLSLVLLGLLYFGYNLKKELNIQAAINTPSDTNPNHEKENN